MNLAKKPIQFNNLVFTTDMVIDFDVSGGFKTETLPYSHSHGSYAVFKDVQQYSREQEVSMTIQLNTKRMSCEQKEHYKDFALLNIHGHGRLWAIQGRQLLWAWAFVVDFSEAYEREPNSFSMDVDFILYEGIWHKTDPLKTFIRPYDPCDFLECEEFKTLDACATSCVDVCNCIPPIKETCTACSCECEHLTEDLSLCSMKDEVLEQLSKVCGSAYRIDYNCEVGAKIWGEEKMLGEKFCKKEICKSVIAGQFYSDTITNSEHVTITIDGVVSNPYLTINGNSVQIKGEYDGKLIITSTGDVFYAQDCCNPIAVDVNNIVIPHGSTFGMTAKHGNNSLVLETNNCCNMTCVYVKVDSITI